MVYTYTLRNEIHRRNARYGSALSTTFAHGALRRNDAAVHKFVTIREDDDLDRVSHAPADRFRAIHQLTATPRRQ